MMTGGVKKEDGGEGQKGGGKGKGGEKGKAPATTLSRETAQRLLQDENLRIRAAIRASMKEAGMNIGKAYRAAAEPSSSEEEELLELAVAYAMGISPSMASATEVQRGKETGGEAGSEEAEGGVSFEAGEKTRLDEADMAGPSTGVKRIRGDEAGKNKEGEEEVWRVEKEDVKEIWEEYAGEEIMEAGVEITIDEAEMAGPSTGKKRMRGDGEGMKKKWEEYEDLEEIWEEYGRQKSGDESETEDETSTDESEMAGPSTGVKRKREDKKGKKKKREEYEDLEEFWEEYSAEESDTEDETTSDESEMAGPSMGVKKKRGDKKGKKNQEEQDWDEFAGDESETPVNLRDFPPDDLGWSRSLEDITLHPFQGRKPRGPTFMKKPSPLKYFFKFFPLALLLSITKWTNKKLSASHMPLTSLQEVRAWFGIHLLMGLVRIQNCKDYWSSSPGLRNTLICNTMKRKRFDVLSQYIACNDPGLDPDLIKDKAHRCLIKQKYPLYALQPAWDKVRRCCLKHYNPSRELTVDEAMIRGFKVGMGKFKVYAIAESTTGFFINFMVHPRSDRPATMNDIALSVARRHLNVYHHIFTDRLFTSVELARTLLSRRTYFTGEVKSGRKGLPRDFSSTDKSSPAQAKMKKLRQAPRGTFYTRQNGQLTATVWKDRKVMMLLSTAHQARRDPAIHTVQRKCEDEQTGHLRPSTIPAPPQAISYIRCMGGVDKGDQLRIYHTCSRKTQQWWRAILYFLIDIARVNAWISYRHHRLNLDESNSSSDSDTPEEETAREGKPLTHSRFTLDVAVGLIDGYARGVPPRQPAGVQPVPAHNSPGHYSAKMPGKNARWCVWCRKHGILTKSGLPKSTRRGCPVCGVNLCAGSCFLKFHQATDNEADSTTITTAVYM